LRGTTKRKLTGMPVSSHLVTGKERGAIEKDWKALRKSARRSICSKKVCERRWKGGEPGVEGGPPIIVQDQPHTNRSTFCQIENVSAKLS